MTDAFVEDFLAGFDDSRFPADFLQHYELMECLSQNEMGETFLVKHRQTGEYHVAKCYADKSLPSHTTEGELLRKLDHEGLPVHLGEYRNERMLCFVRSYAPGQSLDKLARENQFDGQQSLAIGIQLCEILTYLHEQIPPIIHRDIKPQNVIVDEHGQVTLIDFGISRIFDEKLQEDTLCFGTKHYAAPEQYGFSQTDCRSDIFSLGTLLCWLLTGNIEVKQAKKLIPDRRLANIIMKCTAFDPKDRYSSAVQVRDALTGRASHRWFLSFLSMFLILLVAALPFASSIKVGNRSSDGITFKEPLIEEAVRLELGKDETQAISEKDLLAINELYIFGDRATADVETFKIYADSFANNGGMVTRGSIHVLDDLAELKNLRSVSLPYQNISDFTPLSELVYLEYIDLRHNPLEDVAPLSRLPALTSLILFDTNVSDLTALQSCPRLTTLDVGRTLVTSLAAFDGLDSLRTLVIRKAHLRSLDGIESLPMLEQIYLSETPVLDLSPLLDLPRLQLVEVDERMRAASEAVAEQAQFEIIYQRGRD